MIYFLFALLLLALAAIPTAMVFVNLPLFQRTSPISGGDLPAVSVLIPARNEEAGIAAAVQTVLDSRHVRLEILVMDDHSNDRTAAIVEELAQQIAQQQTTPGAKPPNHSLRLLHAAELPSGWNGKQHACWQLSQQAQFERLLFMDADVRLAPEAVARLLAEQERIGCGLLSGFPHQRTESLAEQLLIPLMYFVLLGYLPLARMRTSLQPEFGAGCGQLFLARRQDYLAAGGHEAIRGSRHDGLQLPRSFRCSGIATDVVDASDLASVRMYSDWHSVLQGLQKNATEGIANAKLIFPFSVLLLGAAVLPILTLAHGLFWGWPGAAMAVLGMATLLSFAPRAMLAARFESSIWGTLLHPLAVAIFVAIQWQAFLNASFGGGPVAWKGRH